MNELGQQIKQLRSAQHLSLRQLAERASVTASYISAVERGKLSPTISMLSKLLVALGTDLGAFFTTEQTPQTGFVFHREDMKMVDDGGRRYTFIFPHRGDIHLEVLDEVLLPGEMPEYEQLPVDLAGHVLSGELSLEVAGVDPEIVCAGDAFYVPAGQMVRGRCHLESPVHLITMMTPIESTPDCSR